MKEKYQKYFQDYLNLNVVLLYDASQSKDEIYIHQFALI
jgi:hypothetical protein